MNEPRDTERLLARTRKAFEESSRAWPEHDVHTEPPGPGDVLVPERMADFDVEWAVVARHPADGGRVFVVPADGGSMVGSGDIEIDDRDSGGPWILRCRMGSWLDVEALTPWTRTGKLADVDVDRVWHQWWKLVGRDTVGSVLRREVDDDPEYRSWITDVVLPARAALSSPHRQETIPGKVVRFPARNAWAWLAAALLLVSAGGVIWQQAEQVRLLSRTDPLVNVVVRGVQPSRNRVQDVTVPRGAEYVTLELAFDPRPSTTTYRVDLIETTSAHSVWTSEPLDMLQAGRIWISLRASILPPNDYVVRLLGNDGSVVEEYLVRVSVE